MENKYNIGGQIWVQKDGGNFMGPGRINLLEKLIENNNLKVAAKKANIEYEVALKNIVSINKIANEPLAIKDSSNEQLYTITSYGKKIIQTYKELKKEHEQFLEQINIKFEKKLLDSK
ncbi:hypothetical protein CP960_01565 [Malaciobacter halophilus]|uniref:ModE family transcriptional regulator n=1 Tax=Malaciobacter halophilus TaxID=197482 RepID=A0A2N1J661_9BACT|nr:hypothetical protein [Malaciobacter halophilus]AXH09509.1 putative transcriptional regulator, ModE family [Malaciobacter halophilus]PKI82026.1 hypothetical protein CP960_01565 [Malaciobacter halophilus]